jgi:glycosyltransferase involved in cell wall biosynthesis
MMPTVELPEISVIIPTLNAAATLAHALASVAEQSAPYEAILVDGGSHDATRAIAASTPGLRVIDAPGTSIYGALNCGIAEARGPAIVLLNADDALLPGALEAFLDGLARFPLAAIVRGRPLFVEADATGGYRPLAHIDRRRPDQPLTLELLLRGPCGINSMCIRREVFAQIGLFDTAWRFAADREWLLRAWLAHLAIAELDQTVYRYLVHEGSSTLNRSRRNYAAIRREHLAIIALARAARADNRNLPRLPFALSRWHAAETGMLAAHHLRGWDWRAAAAVIWQGLREAPLWPAALTVEMSMWLGQRMASRRRHDLDGPPNGRFEGT